MSKKVSQIGYRGLIGLALDANFQCLSRHALFAIYFFLICSYSFTTISSLNHSQKILNLNKCFISFPEKPGECPVPASRPCAISALSNVCESDFDCNGASKCCQDKCGSSVCIGPTNGKEGSLLSIIKRLNTLQYRLEFIF